MLAALPADPPRPERPSAITAHDYLPLVRKIALRVGRRCRSMFPPVEIDDLVGYGTVGLLEAASRYEPVMPVPFEVFAYRRIEGAMFDGIRRSSWFRRVDYERHRDGREPSVRFVRFGAADRVLARLPDGHASPADLLEIAEERHALAAAFRSLPERERLLVEGYFLDGLILEDAGRKVGCSQSWASRLLARALRRLREQLSAASAQPLSPRLKGRP